MKIQKLNLMLKILMIIFMLSQSVPPSWARIQSPRERQIGEKPVWPEISQPAPALRQFETKGHVLGFRPGGMSLISPHYALRVEFVGSRSVVPEVAEPVPARASQLASASPPPFQRVTYPELWPGVTLVYEPDATALAKSSYLVAPGAIAATTAQIRLRYNVPAHLDGSGNLILGFESGRLRESAPIAWQEINGHRQPVKVYFTLFDSSNQSKIVNPLVGFTLGPHNPAYPLVIDPGLTWHTFQGSSAEDQGAAIAVDGAGNIYITGDSAASWGANPKRLHNGLKDAFVAKLNSDGQLQWHTFLGGVADDAGQAIGVDQAGNVYVAGNSLVSWQGSSPPVDGFSGFLDIFVAKLNSSGVLQWNTFYGEPDSANAAGGLVLDSNGNIYLAGSTVPEFFTSLESDAFVARFNNNGALLWTTPMQGAAGTKVNGTSVVLNEAGGTIYVGGESNVTWGTPLHSFSGTVDTFVAKLDRDDGQLIWHTFLGSSAADSMGDVAIDDEGEVYVAGLSFGPWTGSPPVHPYSGNADVFVAKVAGGNGALGWHTFMGSSAGTDLAYSLGVDENQNLYVSGQSNADWPGLAVNPYLDGVEAFVARLNRNGVRQWHTFVGHTNESGNSLAIDGDNNLYITGPAGSNWLAPALNLHAGGGNFDIFVAKLPSTPFLVKTISPAGNGRFISPTQIISATFNRPVAGSTVSTTSFTIRGKQSGLYTGLYSAGSGLQFDGGKKFRAGEEIVATVSSKLKAGGDRGGLVPHVWQFQAKVSRGSGQLITSQEFGGKHSQDIALGDLDNDGDLDAFIANDQGEGNEVWLYNHKTGKFTSSQNSLGNRDSQAVALGDIDNDGDLDAIVVNYNQPGQVWFNDKGIFFAGQNLGPARLSRDAALGDLDGDGDLDLFVVNDGETHNVWINYNGAGTNWFDFTLTSSSPGSNSQGVALGDLDNDGDLDAFVANYQQPDKIWWNDGAAKFVEGTQDLGNSPSLDAALGDIDNDGDLDALVANAGGLGQPSQVWLNGADGFIGLFSQGQSLGKANTWSIALGDLDADHDLDAVLGNLGADHVWLNGENGQPLGTFSDSGQRLGSSSTYGLALGDLAGNGALSLVAANHYNEPQEVWSNGISAAGNGAKFVYLPVLLKPDTATTQLFIKSTNTNGISLVEVRKPGTNELILSCTGIGNNVIKLCGTLPSVGAYRIIAKTNRCGQLEDIFSDALGGSVLRSVYCK